MTFNLNNLSRVKVHRNPKYKPDGLKSYARLLRKYNISPTISGPFAIKSTMDESSSRAILEKFGDKVGGPALVPRQVLIKKDANGNVGEVSSEDIQQDTMYLTEVGIGTPAQTFNLDFDTGSADLWVWSTELNQSLQSQGKQDGHSIFNPSNSSTWNPLKGEAFQISYGDGSSTSGDVGTDTLIIGGLTITNQAIELAKQMSAQFQQSSGDGLLGLAWGNINSVTPTQVQTPVENMITQQDIPSSAELFTAYLTSWRDTSDANKGESFFTFGWIDQSIIDAEGSEIYYTPVDNSQGFWQFESASASVNGKTIARQGNTAIADTGTTLALVSDEVCQAIYGSIPGAQLSQEQQGWVFPTNTTAANLPVVQFAVGSQLFTIQKEDLGFADAGNGMVYGGIQSRGNMTFDILGDVFLKSVYVVFDQGAKRLGVLQRAKPTQNLAPPASGGE